MGASVSGKDFVETVLRLAQQAERVDCKGGFQARDATLAVARKCLRGKVRKDAMQLPLFVKINHLMPVLWLFCSFH